MSLASDYFTLIRLESSGSRRCQLFPQAKAFLQQQCPEFGLDSTLSDANIQTQLMAIVQRSNNATETMLAALCLRCYISHRIVSACIFLVNRFGRSYRFTLADILPFVLTDRGRDAEFAGTLAARILQTFQPEKSSLATWTMRLVKHDPELDRFLIQQGLYRVSDWAILNDTTLTQLQRILTHAYSLPSSDVKQACSVLESYQAVKASTSNRCMTPTSEQLHRMSQSMPDSLPPKTLLKHLQRIASYLRHYRVAVRGGLIARSLLQSTIHDQANSTCIDDAEETQAEFLDRYQQEVIAGLDAAVTGVIRDRVQSGLRRSTTQFLTALDLFYNQNLSMSQIAVQLELSTQSHVTRLLKLKQLRAEVERQLIDRLNQSVPAIALQYTQHPIDQAVQSALAEQVETLLQHDAKICQATVQHRQAKRAEHANLFAERLRLHLKQYHAGCKDM